MRERKSKDAIHASAPAESALASRGETYVEELNFQDTRIMTTLLMTMSEG